MALADLTAALDRLDAKILEVSCNPKPNYSIDGQSVSWESYYSGLLKSRQLLAEQIALAGSPYELRTEGVT